MLGINDASRASVPRKKNIALRRALMNSFRAPQRTLRAASAPALAHRSALARRARLARACTQRADLLLRAPAPHLHACAARAYARAAALPARLRRRRNNRLYRGVDVRCASRLAITTTHCASACARCVCQPASASKSKTDRHGGRSER